MFIHSKTGKKYYSIREKINYYIRVIDGKIPNVSPQTKRKAKGRLKTLTRLNERLYNEPTLVVTNDTHFGNKISKPRLCVAYKTDSKGRVLVHPIRKRTCTIIILNYNIDRQVEPKFKPIDKNDIYEQKYVFNPDGKQVNIDKKDMLKIQKLY